MSQSSFPPPQDGEPQGGPPQYGQSQYGQSLGGRSASPAPSAEGTACGPDGVRYTLGKVELNGAQVSKQLAGEITG